ncbi:hypothetical protein [Photorhabdus laumondii]|nr:hypothetical protein [Photorhabdus laumondii]
MIDNIHEETSTQIIEKIGQQAIGHWSLVTGHWSLVNMTINNKN